MLPILITDQSEASAEAKRLLDEAGIEYDERPVGITFLDGDAPLPAIRWENSAFYGLGGVKIFIETYKEYRDNPADIF